MRDRRIAALNNYVENSFTECHAELSVTLSKTPKLNAHHENDITQSQNYRFRCWNIRIPELNNRTVCLNSKIPELNNRTACLNSKIPSINIGGNHTSYERKPVPLDSFKI